MLRAVFLSCAAAAFAVACSDTAGDPTVIGGTRPSLSTGTTVVQRPIGEVLDGQPFPAERCQANRAAGTIRIAADIAATTAGDNAGRDGSTRLVASSDDFAALCLDVELVPSAPTDSYILVAAQQANMALASNLVELADYAGRNDARLVGVDIAGPIDESAVLYTTTDFVNNHPTAVQDVVRAWRHTIADDDPVEAATPIDLDAVAATLDAATDAMNGPIVPAADLITTSVVDGLINPDTRTLIWPEG